MMESVSNEPPQRELKNMITLIDYMTGEIYFQDEKKYYPTPEEVQQLKRTIARNEGLDVSQIIIRENVQ
jgi:hypothetical protein